MIGSLKGTLIEKNADHILLDVHGVGYEIEIPASSLCLLPPLDSELKLFILTYVREDAIRLFGFASQFDKKIFYELIQVSGVGPKAALALLGPVDGYELCEIILQGHLVKLTAIPGVGPKTAERLILELKSKMQKLISRKKDEVEIQKTKLSESIAGSVLSEKKVSQKLEQKLLRRQVIEDLKSALGNLGYKDKQYQEVIQNFEQRMQLGEDFSIEFALKEALTKLSERVLRN